jgi:hypothetical protein
MLSWGALYKEDKERNGKADAPLGQGVKPKVTLICYGSGT